MAPLLMFLNSSLNVELVYIILKSITQFGVMIKPRLSASLRRTSTFIRKSKKKSDVTIDEETGNAHLTLKKIKVKDYESWSRASSTMSTISEQIDAV